MRDFLLAAPPSPSSFLCVLLLNPAHNKLMAGLNFSMTLFKQCFDSEKSDNNLRTEVENEPREDLGFVVLL